MPGWGVTELTIEAKLYNSKKQIGDVKATRSVGAGGVFTKGEWKDIFDDLATEVIDNFKKEFKKQNIPL